MKTTLSKSAQLATFARKPPFWAIVLLAAIANFAAAQLTALVPIEGGPGKINVVLWAPAGIIFSLVWHFGRPAVIGSFLGVFSYLLGRHGSLLFATAGAIGPALSAWYACWQLRRNDAANPFASPRNILHFIVIAVLIAPLLSVSLGTIFSLPILSSLYQWSVTVWLVACAGHAIAILLIAPVLLRVNDWRTVSRRGWLELLGWSAGILIIWLKLFATSPHLLFSPAPLMIAPFLILMAFRFNFGVAASFSLLLSILIQIMAAHDLLERNHNPFFFAITYLGALGLSNIAIGAGSVTLRRSIQKLTKSEALLRGVFEQAAVGIMLYDIKENKRTFNAKFRDLFGFSDKETEQLDVRSYTFPEEQNITEEFTRQLHRGDIESFNQEKRYRRKDGDMLWISLTISMLRSKNGASRYMIGVFEDITPRKRAEKQLQGQARILQALASDAALPEQLRDLALFAEELWPTARSAISLADAKAEYLHLGAAPTCQAQPAAPIQITENINPTASAAARRQNVICGDMLAAPEFAALRPLIEVEPWRRAWWAVPFTAKNGELLGVLSVYFEHPRTPTAQDHEFIVTLSSLAGIVVQHYRDEERLRDSENIFRITFEQAPVGVALLDRNANWLQINQKFCEIVGYTYNELLQLPYRKLIAPEDMELTSRAIDELFNSSALQIQLEHRYMRKNSDVIWVSSQFSVTRDASSDVDYRIAVIRDITERKLAEAEVERLALYDYLTGLPNRRLFGDRLRTAVMAAKRSARYGALIYLDLDNFKQLNDTHGHNAGDDFLKMVAHRLQRNLREEDTVARLGGDEFVILLQNVSDSLPETATATAAIAEKVQSALSEPFLLPSGIEHIVTSSLGITLFPKDVESAEDLLKEADIAMYRVKAARRNAMRFYEPAMKAEVDSRLALERALRRALHDDEFELYLQPQYDAERNMVSCEALLRWPQSDGGFISPNEFIPIAEETGLIVPLGEWVLRRAGKLARALELAGHTISIAVNVSPRQFNEANFVERVRTILWEAGADAGRIVLEITEGVVVADFDDVRTKMLALRRMGICLSIDDFGTGHSSLAYLKLLPLHELKIDRAFVTALPDDTNDVAIVEAILAVASHLQFEVVAEGVETDAQLEFLKQRGCQRFQGYLLGRPAPPHHHFPELKIT